MLLTQFAVSFPLHPLLKESISVKYAIPKNFLAAWQRGNKSLFSEKQMSIQFKRISHHSTKLVKFFVKEHHILCQTVRQTTQNNKSILLRTYQYVH